MGALFACIFHLVSNCQESICTQSVAEISIKSFIGEVVKFTYLIAHKWAPIFIVYFVTMHEKGQKKILLYTLLETTEEIVDN